MILEHTRHLVLVPVELRGELVREDRRRGGGGRHRHVLRPAIVKVEAEPRRRRRPLVVQLRQAHHLVPLRLARKRGGSRCCWCWRWAGAASRWISFQRPRSLQCHTVTCHSKVTESESGWPWRNPTHEERAFRLSHRNLCT
ncbi:hypothetical protein DAI22_05g088900 [Oryza sativa Japonica Group]|nr:hypothetical protein DAI22_05g088900 [Oryza sativa Japonica Group]